MTRSRMSRNVPRTLPLTRYRIRPTCSTAYRRRGSAGVDAIAVKAESPLAYGRTVSCCCAGPLGTTSAAAARSGATISVQSTGARPPRFLTLRSFSLLLNDDVAELVLLAALEDREHLV